MLVWRLQLPRLCQVLRRRTLWPCRLKMGLNVRSVRRGGLCQMLAPGAGRLEAWVRSQRCRLRMRRPMELHARAGLLLIGMCSSARVALVLCFVQCGLRLAMLSR